MANPRKPSVSHGPSAAPAVGRPPTAHGRSLGRATQATVAEQAGVTPMTVSRFLRAPAQVAPNTAVKIRAALQRTGYTPNKHAGMLAGRRSSIVAVIVPSIASATFSGTVQALSDGLQSHALELLLAATNYDPQREEQQIRAVLAWSPSALVVACAAICSMRSRISRWKPLITASVVISAATPIAMPRMEASEMKEMKPLRRLARR